jgi:hypothetical protein
MAVRLEGLHSPAASPPVLPSVVEEKEEAGGTGGSTTPALPETVGIVAETKKVRNERGERIRPKSKVRTYPRGR